MSISSLTRMNLRPIRTAGAGRCLKGLKNFGQTMQYHNPSANASNVAEMMAISRREREGKHINVEQGLIMSKVGASGAELNEAFDIE